MGINFYVLCLLIACFSGDVIDRTMMSRVSKSIQKIKEKYRKASKGKKILVTKRTITGKEEKNEKLQKLTGILGLNTVAMEYLHAFMRFQMMMGDISKSIGDVVKEVAGE